MVDISCIVSAVFFVLSAIFTLMFRWQAQAWKAGRLHQLDPDYLQDVWEFRDQKESLLLAGAFIRSLAWFIMAFPTIRLAWILSHGGTKSIWLHLSIGLCAFGVAFVQWMATLFFMGEYLSSRYVFHNFNINRWVTGDSGMGVRTLEVNHYISRGAMWFIDLFEWICLAFLMLLIYVSVRQWRVHDVSCFGGTWNSLGLFVGLMAFAEFCVEVAALEGVRSVNMAVKVYTVSNRLVFLPSWLIILSCSIDRAVIKQAYGTDGPGELALSEMRTNTANDGPPPQSAFSIDDDPNSGGGPPMTTLDDALVRQ